MWHSQIHNFKITKTLVIWWSSALRFRPITCHENPEGEQKYISTLSLTSALDGSGWLTPRPGRFTSGKDTRYPFYRRISGLHARPGWVRKISPHRDSIPGPSSPSRVAIPTELSRPTVFNSRLWKLYAVCWYTLNRDTFLKTVASTLNNLN